MAQTSTNLDEFLGAPAKKPWRRWAKWGGIGLGLIIVLLILARCFGGKDDVRYATAPVSRGQLTVSVSATGKLAPTNQVQVGSELSGLVDKLLVDVNDRVTKGQPLAILDTSRLDDSITQSNAALNANLAQVAQAQATLQESRSQLSRQEEVYRLSGGRVPSKSEMDSARAAVARAQANVAAAQANVVSARAQLSTNKTQRFKAIIRSPVNGVVLARQIDLGQTIAASFNAPTLFVIAEDLSTMKLQVSIDEADVAQVKQGQRASFTVDAFPGRTFPATITRVDLGSNLSAQANTTQTSGQGQVVSYAATLAVANPNLDLRPGMTATAEIITMHKGDVLLVPNAALRFTPTQAAQRPAGIAGAFGGFRPPGADKRAGVARGATQTVYVAGADGKPKAVEITTGESNGMMTEVLSGPLKPGTKVITGQLANPNQRPGGAGGPPGGGGGR